VTLCCRSCTPTKRPPKLPYLTHTKLFFF
jgi:hypothetical protein